MDFDYKLEDFPTENDINWQEFAKEFGIETTVKFLEYFGGRSIWVLAMSKVINRRNDREQRFRRQAQIVPHGTQENTQ